MKCLAEFRFLNNVALEPQATLLNVAIDELAVELTRRVRTTTLLGMKQPLRAGAIMGLGVWLRIAHYGRPAAFYQWQLFCNGLKIQRGTTNRDGASEDLRITLSETDAYELKVFAPKRL